MILQKRHLQVRLIELRPGRTRLVLPQLPFVRDHLADRGHAARLAVLGMPPAADVRMRGHEKPPITRMGHRLVSILLNSFTTNR